MKILTVNAGSSSIRLSAFAREDNKLTQLASFHTNLVEISPEQVLKKFMADYHLKEIHGVSHRVVHGGRLFNTTCLIDEEVERAIEKLSTLAPLHNPVALQWIQQCKAVPGLNVPQVAVFDTAFYASLPDVATTYALPKDLCQKYEIRRYGFHGIAHQAMWQRWRELRADLPEGGKIISLQLGAGCSLTAVDRGSPIDTSMGFSPLEGLVMATRSGDIDPGIFTYLQKAAGLSASEVETMLNNSAGLLGVSGISSDMKTLLESNHPDARLAISLFCYRIKKYIGAYMTALSSVNGILFGGGMGENAPVIREKILEKMQWCGIELDDKINKGMIGNEGCISNKNSEVEVWVMPVDEAAILAHEAVLLLENI
jgi:acetate kinase